MDASKNCLLGGRNYTYFPLFVKDFFHTTRMDFWWGGGETRDWGLGIGRTDRNVYPPVSSGQQESGQWAVAHLGLTVNEILM